MAICHDEARCASAIDWIEQLYQEPRMQGHVGVVPALR